MKKNRWLDKICYKSSVLIFCLTFLVYVLNAQTFIYGKIVDETNKPIPGVSIIEKGTYNGTSADIDGNYKLKLSKTENSIIHFSFIGYQLIEKAIDPEVYELDEINIDVQMKEEINELTTVVISAGQFEVAADKKNVMLKPMDIASVASAGADITSVMNLLPGAQKVGESEGLFIRGGSNLESKVMIDELYVQNPFYSPNPGVAQRGRFSPFMFKGTTFSTGGFSAKYGQALSSVLLLETNDKLDENGFNVSLNLMSIMLTGVKSDEKQSISGTAYYGNTGFWNKLVVQNLDWIKAPEYKGANLTYVRNFSDKTSLKSYSAYSKNVFALKVIDFNSDTLGLQQDYEVENDNLFFNAILNIKESEKWEIKAGLSANSNRDNYLLKGQSFKKEETQIQMRLAMKRKFSQRASITFGGDLNQINNQDFYSGFYDFSIENINASFFAEPEYFITKNIGIKIGGRLDYASEISEYVFSPRFSAAYKSPLGQFSLAGGLFTQTPNYKYLYTNKNLKFEKAEHFILGYQLIKNYRTIKAEVFHKRYEDLVLENIGHYIPDHPFYFPSNLTNNNGFGYAKGFDLFWRDKKTFKHTEYWITYTFIDSRRKFKSYPINTTPHFVSKNNISVVYKKSFPSLNLNVGGTYSYTSKRPYYNPENERFLSDYTPEIHQFGLSASYLTNIKGNFTILYCSVDNVFNSNIVYTYQYYSDKKNREAVVPAMGRSFFIGAIIYFSKKFEIPDDYKINK